MRSLLTGPCVVAWLALGFGVLGAPVFAFGPTVLAAITEVRSERVRPVAEVEAAYLVNFIRFTEWPAQVLPEELEFRLGVVGSEEVENYLLKSAADMHIRGRRLNVLRLKSPEEALDCQLVFIPAAVKDVDWRGPVLEAWLAAIAGRPVLSVSDHPEFVRLGGMIGFYLEGPRLRFEIEDKRVAAAGLQMSSRLLALAHPQRAGRPPTTDPRLGGSAPPPSAPSRSSPPPASGLEKEPRTP